MKYSAPGFDKFGGLNASLYHIFEICPQQKIKFEFMSFWLIYQRQRQRNKQKSYLNSIDLMFQLNPMIQSQSIFFDRCKLQRNDERELEKIREYNSQNVQKTDIFDQKIFYQITKFGINHLKRLTLGDIEHNETGKIIRKSLEYKRSRDL